MLAIPSVLLVASSFVVVQAERKSVTISTGAILMFDQGITVMGFTSYRVLSAAPSLILD